MPKGPRGEKRPGDVIGAAIMVGKIATGEVEDNASFKLRKIVLIQGALFSQPIEECLQSAQAPMIGNRQRSCHACQRRDLGN